MANYILSKTGGQPYRYTKSGSTKILRTPLTVTLQPDAMASYQMAGTYDSKGNPTNGYIAQNSITKTDVTAIGYEFVTTSLISPYPTNQHWRSVTNGHEPETAWYQGCFAPSEDTIAKTYMSSEAYGCYGAYHFSLPDLPDDIDLTMKLKWINGGGFQCYGSAGAKSSSNTCIKG